MLSNFLTVFAGCSAQIPAPQNLSPAVVIKQQGMDALHVELAAKVTSATAETMTKSGLAGAIGGAHVKLLKTGAHEVILPLPQLVDGQVPICCYIRSTPSDAAVEYRIQRREELNGILSVQLKDAHHLRPAMSHPDFQPYYADGQRVRVGDRVLSAGPPERIVTGVFDPDHEVSRLYDMRNGCAQIAPATIEILPLNEDIVLVARGSEGPSSTPPVQ